MIILIAIGVIYVSLLVFSMVMMAITKNLEPLVYIIPATAAEFATATGFYYNKAKCESKIKLSNGMNEEGK